MEITVLFFSLFRDLVGADQKTFSLPEGGKKVSEILAEIYQIHPDLEPWDTRMLVALNHEYADRDQLVRPGDEMALMPPVQGG